MAGLVARPLEAVHQLFEQSGGNESGDWGVRATFESALADPTVLAQVIMFAFDHAFDAEDRAAYPGSWCVIVLGT